jgi:non-ribosomal peptide synthase protein (TIGR01720 family)
MAQVVWLDAGSDRPGRLVVLVHHLAVDAVSWSVLVGDLAAAWRAAVAGTAPVLSRPGTSLRTWSRVLVEQARVPARVAELGLWVRQLAGVDPLLTDVPLDRGRDVVGSACSLTRTLSAEDTLPLLTVVPAAFHAGVNDVLVTGFVVAVAAWRAGRGRGRDSAVLVELESHGRHEVVDGVDVSTTVGWFTNTFPVRLDAGLVDMAQWRAGGAAVGRAVKMVKEQLRAIPDHGIGYGMLRYLNEETAEVLAGLPTPQLIFNYLGRVDTGQSHDYTGPDSPHGGSDGQDAGVGRLWQVTDEAGGIGGGADPGMPMQHGLALNAVTIDGPDGPRLTATWSWPAALLTEESVAELADLWWQALRGLGVHTAASPHAGGLTPSDVPLVAVGQSEIEQLESAVGVLVDVLPLTPLQEGLLFHSVYDGSGIDMYVDQLAFDIEGVVDLVVLRAAVDRLLARHANLRAGFWYVGLPQPVQFVPEWVEVPWQEVDLSGAVDVQEQARRWLAEDLARRFDLARPPLLRFALLRLAADRYRFVVTNHHLLLDGWSMALLVAELSALYAAGGVEVGLARPVPYREYLVWLSGRGGRCWRG